jgi:AraC-like DNA-binding protein
MRLGSKSDMVGSATRTSDDPCRSPDGCCGNGILLETLRAFERHLAEALPSAFILLNENMQIAYRSAEWNSLVSHPAKRVSFTNGKTRGHAIMGESAILQRREIVEARPFAFDKLDIDGRRFRLVGRPLPTGGYLMTLREAPGPSQDELAKRREEAMTRPASLSKQDYDRRTIELATAIYAAGLRSPPGVQELASRLRINRTKLNNLFWEFCGMSPAAYGKQVRLDWARTQLAKGNMKVGSIAQEIGFGDTASFSRAYKAHFGKPPTVDSFERRLSNLRFNRQDPAAPAHNRASGAAGNPDEKPAGRP